MGIGKTATLLYMMPMKVFHDFSYCYMVRSFQRPFGGMQDFCYLAVFHVVKIMKGKHGALHIWKRGHGLQQQGMGFVAVKIFVSHQLVGQIQVVGTVCCEDILVSSEKIERFVDGNTVEPGDHLRVSLKTVNIVPCLEKRILQHIIGILMVEHKMTYFPVQLLAVQFHHHLKSLLLVLF